MNQKTTLVASAEQDTTCTRGPLTGALSWAPYVETRRISTRTFTNVSRVSRSTDSADAKVAGADSSSVFQSLRGGDSFSATGGGSAPRATEFSNVTSYQRSVYGGRFNRRPSSLTRRSLTEKLAQLDIKSKKSTKIFEDLGPPPVFADLNAPTSVRTTVHVIRDPQSVPAIRESTSVCRQEVFFLEHWGRSALTEYSSVNAVAADGVWCIAQGASTRDRDADYRALVALMRPATTQPPAIADAKAQFDSVLDRLEGVSSEESVKGAIDAIIAGVDVDVMETLQKICVTVGCYAVAEVVAKRRLELVYAAKGPCDPETLWAHHLLGTILLRSGFHADAECCFDAALDGFTLTPDELEEMIRDSENACESAVCLSVALREQGMLTESEERLQVVASVSAAEFGENHECTLRAAGELALTHVRQNRIEAAAPALQHVFQTRASTLGTEHPMTLAAWENLAALQAAQGQRDAAIESYEQVLTKRRVLFGATHPDTLMCERQLAIQRNSPAEKFEQLWLQWSALRGAESIHALCALHDLGVRMCRAHEYAAAAEVFQRAYKGFSNACGVEHKTTVDSSSKIVSALIAQGVPLADVDPHLQAVHRAVRTRCGAQHVDTLKSANNVAVMHYRRFRYPDSFQVFKDECITPWLKHSTRKIAARKTMTQNMLSPLASMSDSTDEDLAYALVLQNYSFACANNDQITEGETTLKGVWQNLERILGREHPNTLTAMHHYGAALKTARKLQEAEKVLSEVIQLREKVLGPDHLETLESHFVLGWTQKLARKFKEAWTAQNHAYDKRMALVGPKHLDTLDSEYYLSLWLISQDIYEEAENKIQRCIEGYKETMGDMYPQLYHSMSALGIVHSQRGKPEECLKSFKAALTGLERIFGERNLQFLLALTNTAMQYDNSSEYSEAIAMYKRALDGYVALVGRAHPHPVWVSMQIGLIYHHIGQLNEAISYFNWGKEGFEEMRRSDMTGLDPSLFSKVTEVETLLRDKSLFEPSLSHRMAGSLVKLFYSATT